MKEISKAQLAYDDFLIQTLNDSEFNYGSPTNLQKVKTEFNKKRHNPIFEYKYDTTEIEKIKHLLQSIHLKKEGNPDIHHLQKAFLKEKITQAKMYSQLGTEQFTIHSKQIYGSPNTKLQEFAKEILNDTYKTVPKLPKITAQTTMQKLRDGFKERGITGWSLKRVPMSASASVNTKTRELKLKSRERFQEPFVKRLIVHEIGTHVVRYENGLMQPLKMFSIGTAGYLSTEEGLAVLSEELAECSSETQMRNYAGRVLANTFAQEGSFLETYKNLREYFGHKDAFKLTVRSKRGIADTAEKGGLTKDHVYLKGYVAVKSYAKKNPLNDLYIGKIGLKDLKVIKKIEHIKEPKILPSFVLTKTA